MKKFRKTALLALALTMLATTGFAACGGDNGKGNSSSQGDGVIGGEAFADEAAWRQALGNTAAATNATMKLTDKEEGKRGDVFVTEEGDGTYKVSDGKMYGYMSYTESRYEEIGGAPVGVETYVDEDYCGKIDDVLTRFSKHGKFSDEWTVYEYEKEYSVNVGFMVEYADLFCLDDLAEMYECFVYENGTYTYSVTEGDRTSTLDLRFASGMLVYGRYFSRGYESTYTFTYGDAVIGALPGEGGEDGGNQESSENGDGQESSSEKSENEGGSGVVSESMTEAQWQTAINDTLAATNFSVSGNIVMEAMGIRESGTNTLKFEENKLFWEEETVTGTYRGYVGKAYDASSGMEVPIEWIWDNATSSWDCDYYNMGSVTTEDAFACLTCETYIDRLYNAYAYAVYNSEKGCYVIDLASLTSDSTLTGTLEVTFANGLISKIKCASEEEIFEGFSSIKEYEYTITYGGAIVGNLPAVSL